MKKTFLSIIMLLSLLFLTSCDKNKEVRQFATDFAAAVQSGNKSEIAKMYPDAAKADSLSFAFDAERAEIETLDDGSIKITLGDGKDIVLVKNDGDDGMKVKASHGVFAYPSDRLDLAKKTGQWKEGLNDVEQNERMADTLFVKYLKDIIIADLKNNVKVTQSKCTGYDMNKLQGICSVVVSNHGERPIEGDEYVVTAKLYDQTNGMYDFELGRRIAGSVGYCGSRTLTGKPIPANGEASYTFRYDVGAYPTDPVCTISLNPKIENIMDSYQSTGREYEEYLSQKAN